MNLRGWVYRNHSDSRENQYDNAQLNSVSSNGSFRQQVEATVQGVTLQPKYDFGKTGTLALALGAESDSWDNAGFRSPVSGAPVDLSAHKSYDLYSAGAEYEVTPVPGLGLVVGYGHYWQDRSEMNLDNFSLLAGLSYELSKETRLKASFKRNVRFPALGDLYDPDKGNSQLLAEISRSYEAGVEQKLPLDSQVALTGFYTTVENLIQTDQDTSRSSNLADVRFAGAELSAATRFVPNLLLRASYSYLHSEDRSRAGREEQQYTPGDKVTLEAKYDLACGFTPYVSLLYVGNQYLYTKNNAPVVQKARLNDFTVVNLKLSQRLLQGRASVYLGANNLFDENYETSYGFPQPGRLIYGGVEFKL